jgi:hypothetical protein
MLSSEDSRRLAQLERQVRRDDPDFYDRMTGDERRHGRRPLLLIVLAAVIWPTAILLGIFSLWIPAAIAAFCATVLVAVVTYRLLRRRPHTE